MRVLMVAPPGAGKGTQGALIAAHFGIPHIATGELLRDHVARRTGLGVAVQGFLDRGDLVPDQVVLDMVREAVVAARAAGGGYVLDGVPRNMEQARALYLIAVELGMTADVALHLEAGDAEVARRLLARAALEHRSDDTAEVIAQRLALYHQVTAPILSWYRDRQILVSVDAMRPVQQVSREILTALDRIRPLLDHAPGRAGHPADLTALGEAFGAAGPAADLPADRPCTAGREEPGERQTRARGGGGGGGGGGCDGKEIGSRWQPRKRSDMAWCAPTAARRSAFRSVPATCQSGTSGHHERPPG